jgi:succinate dehydrogenase / fumarate reductase cytochrome b subunit
MQTLLNSAVGKKLLMAVSGQVMILFIILHVIGNSTVYSDNLNAYAEQLHSLPVILWIYRPVMLLFFLIHVVVGIQLYIENRGSKPQAYAVHKSLRATVAGKTMIWTGLLIGAFLVYHLLHFTLQVTNPEISAKMNMDALGRPDVFKMVMLSFRKAFISFTYVFSMIALFLHLTHGFQSSLQTLGLNNDRTLPFITKAGFLSAFIIFLGYASIPIVIFIGLKG